MFSSYLPLRNYVFRFLLFNSSEKIRAVIRYDRQNTSQKTGDERTNLCDRK